MDEVFGSENFCRLITFTKTTGYNSKPDCVSMRLHLWYAKDKSMSKVSSAVTSERVAGDDGAGRIYWRNSARWQLQSNQQLKRLASTHSYSRDCDCFRLDNLHQAESAIG